MPGDPNHFDLKKSARIFARLTAQVAPLITTDGSTAGGSLCAERDSAGEAIFHRCLILESVLLTGGRETMRCFTGRA